MILFRTTLKRCFKKPSIIITLLIIPIICLIIDYPFKGNNDIRTLNNYTIAICDDDNSIASKTLIDKIAWEYNVNKASSSEINTLVTNRNCDWAIIITKGFQQKLMKNGNALIESYGFAHSEKWEPVKLNIRNLVISIGAIIKNSDPKLIKQNLKSFELKTNTDNYNFLKKLNSSTTPGTGLTIYAIIILYGAYLLSRMFVEDKENELTVRIATTPMPPWRYLLENLACFSVILILQNILMILAYSTIIPKGIVHPVQILLTFITYSIMTVGLMLTISTLCSSSFVMLCSSTGAIMLLSMFGGLFVPVKFMPSVMKKIAMITPTYWFNEAINSIFSKSSGFLFQISMLIGFGIVFYLVGSWKKYSKLD